MQKWSILPDAPLRIAFVLFDQFSNLCLANCLEPLRAANGFAKSSIFEWSFHTPDGEPVSSSSGLPILPNAAANACPPCDYAFVLASYGHLEHDTIFNRRMLRQIAKRAQVVIGLDTGPWLMAAAGLLDGRRATLHWDVLDDFSEKFSNTDALRHRVVWDGSRITCAGAMSAFDLTRDLIRRHLGNAMALDVDALFLRDDPTAPTPRRYDQMRPSSVQRAISVMQQNIETPVSLASISDQIACPPKTLSRRFASTMGASPGAVYRHIRLTHARHLVDTTALNIYEIALRCGYDSPAALSRAYKKRFGQAPRTSRKG